MAPSKTIQDLQPGERVVEAVYLLEEKQVRTTRGGSPYLSARLSDSSGRIEGRLWDLPPGLAESLVQGQGVRVSGAVTEYQGQIQLKIEAIQPHSAEVRGFLPASSRPSGDMVAELERRIGGVADPWLRQLLEAVFDDAFRARFAEAPAAKKYHHAYLGGLIEHSLGVAALAEVVAPLYPQIPRDLLLALALLHDVGKVETYDWQSSLARSDKGELLEHLYMGTRQVERAMEGIPGFPEDLCQRILHALLAHHGQEAFGSPVRPKTLEAVVLHQLDMLDSRIQGFLEHVDRQADAGGGWTEWSKMFGARLYRGAGEPRTDDAGDDAGASIEGLWGWVDAGEGDDLPF